MEKKATQKTEKKKAYDRQYLILNRERLNEKSKLYRRNHPEQRLAEGRRYRAKYPEKIRERAILFKKTHPELKERYDFLSRRATLKIDISFEDYKRLVEKQKGFCAICGEKEKYTYKSGKVKALALDHCHKTKKPRELLCQQCNTALGGFKDNIDLLNRAIIYLQKHL